jgi:hypothetical protein
MTLEIRVKDEVKVFDEVATATEFVVKKIQEWFAEDEDQVFEVSLRKETGRSPPTLGISVNETVKTKETLG